VKVGALPPDPLIRHFAISAALKEERDRRRRASDRALLMETNGFAVDAQMDIALDREATDD